MLEFDSEGLAGEVATDIRVDDGIRFRFAANSDPQLAKFAQLQDNPNPERSPVLCVRCYNKSSIADLVGKAATYNEVVGLGGVVVAAPAHLDNDVTLRAYHDANTAISDAFPDTPFIFVSHEQQDDEGELTNAFDAPLNLVTAIVRHQLKKYGVDSDVPLWSHSYAPELHLDQLRTINDALAVSPYVLSVRTKTESLELPDGIAECIAALGEHLDNLPDSLPVEYIPTLKQLCRNTCGFVSVQNQCEATGGLNRLFGGEQIHVDKLPDSVRPEGHSGVVIQKLGGEEDIENTILRGSRNLSMQEQVRQMLEGPVVPYFDPDVRPERQAKYARAWSQEPHPAHHGMFPQIAQSDMHRAALAIQTKIAENNHTIPEDWRGVRFV